MAGLNTSPLLALGREWVRVTKAGDVRAQIQVAGSVPIEILPNMALPTEATNGVVYGPSEKYREDNLDGATVWIRSALANYEAQAIVVTPSDWADALPALGGALTASIQKAAIAGTSVVDLPDPVKGEQRSITPNDGRFVLTASGDVVRGASAVAGSKVSGEVVQRRGAERVRTPFEFTIVDLSPALTFPAVTIAESAAIGSTVGALSVVNASGPFTYSKTTDADGKFAVASNGNVTLAAGFDFETKTAHAFGARATNGAITLDLTFTVNVGNVLEGTLAPTTANLAAGAPVGTTVATVSGLDAGANETLASLSITDGRFAIASGNRIVTGMTAIASGTIALTATTSAGRTLVLNITVATPALVLSARSIAPEALAGTVVGEVSGLRSGSALSAALAAPFFAASGVNVVKGAAALRAGYSIIRLGDVGTDGTTIYTDVTVKTGRTSRLLADFEDLTNWTHANPARVSLNTGWSEVGTKSLRIVMPVVANFTGSIDGTTLTVTAIASGTILADLVLTAGSGLTANTRIVSQLSGTTGGVGTYQVSNSQAAASQAMAATPANQTLLSTSPAGSFNGEWGLDKIYSIDFNVEGSVVPTNLSVRLLNAAGTSVWYNLNSWMDIGLGHQRAVFCGKHMVAGPAPSAMSGPITRVAVTAQGGPGMSVCFDALRENAGGQAGFIVGADDASDDIGLRTEMAIARGLRRPYLALQAAIVDSFATDQPRVSEKKLQQHRGINKLAVNVGPGTYTQSEADPATQQNGTFYVVGTGIDASNPVKLQKQETDGSWTDLATVTASLASGATTGGVVVAIPPRAVTRVVPIGTAVITPSVLGNTLNTRLEVASGPYVPTTADITVGGPSMLIVTGTGIDAASPVKLQKREADKVTWTDLATVTAAGSVRVDVPAKAFLRTVVGGSASGVSVTLIADIGTEYLNHSINHPSLNTTWDNAYNAATGTEADKVAAGDAAVALEMQGCADYIHGTGPRKTSGAAAADAATGIDISTRVLPNGRRVKSSAYHVVLPNGSFNAGAIAALRKLGIVAATGVLAGGYAAKDGLTLAYPLRRKSMNIASADPSGIRGFLAWAQYIVDTKQVGECFDHTFGNRTVLWTDPDNNLEWAKTAISTQMWAYKKMMDGWVASDGVTPMKGIAQHVADGALSLTRLEQWERMNRKPLANVGANLEGGSFNAKGYDDAARYNASIVRDPVTNQVTARPDPNYAWPTVADVNYLAGLGVTTIRVPFMYHHLFNVVSETDPTQDVKRDWDWAQLKPATDRMNELGITMVFDMHCYDYKTPRADPGSTTASDHFASKFYQDTAADKDVIAKRWVNCAREWKAYTNVWYNPINEPTGKEFAPSTAGVFNIYQAIINAVAVEDPNPAHVFLLDGNHYASPDAWTKTFGGTSSAAEFMRIVDPRGGKPIASLHTYIDADTRNNGANIAGSHPGKEVNPVIPDFADSPAKFTFNGTTYSYDPCLKAATEHARANGYKLFAGEFAGDQSDLYVNENRRLVDYMTQNRDVWVGWTYWGGGTWWPKQGDPDTAASKIYSPLPMDRASPLVRPVMAMLSEFLPIGA